MSPTSTEGSSSSLADVEETVTRGAVWVRRLYVAALVAMVLGGAAGVFGVRTNTTTTVNGGYRLSLEHASLARAGMDVPWQVTVSHEGGYGKELTLAVTGDYFDIYETQGFSPEPSATTRDARTLYLTFDAPEGEVFTLAYDAYIQPSSQRGEDGTVSVLGSTGEPVVTVEFETRLWP
jgi:hypothetical protein